MFRILTICLFLVIPTFLFGQDDAVDTAVNALKSSGEQEQDFMGWDRLSDLKANFFFADNDKVVGKTNGLTTTIGGKFRAALYHFGDHEFRNDLNIDLSFTRDPLLKAFTKNSDEFDFLSLYIYHIPNIKWLGAYAKANLNTSLLKSFDQQSTTSNYLITRTNGTQSVSTNKLKLTDPFKPLRLEESVGAFFKPYTSEEFSLEALLGPGFRQVFANNQLVLREDGTTPEIDVAELQNFQQIGAETQLFAKGSFDSKRFGYETKTSLFLPFYDSLEDDGRNLMESSIWKLSHKFSAKILSWASLEYNLNVVRDPQILDDFQISNSILLNFSAALLPSKSGKI